MALEHIAENLETVRARMGAAASRSNRDPAGITLVAVSKTFGVDHIRAAWAAGQREFGENKVQEALQKIGNTADIPIKWHLIGHLQSNKTRKAAAPFSCIHSVDSLELLQRLEAAAADAGATPQILVQVDLAGEVGKFGARSDAARRLVDAALGCTAVKLRGLMLLPPWSDDPELARPWFRQLRELQQSWITAGVPRDALGHLSMGMSHDFEAAIEEGATMVRVGTAIFGKRTPVIPRP